MLINPMTAGQKFPQMPLAVVVPSGNGEFEVKKD